MIVIKKLGRNNPTTVYKWPDFISLFSSFSAERLSNFVIALGNEFNSNATSSFDPSVFTPCVVYPGNSLNEECILLMELPVKVFRDPPTPLSVSPPPGCTKESCRCDLLMSPVKVTKAPVTFVISPEKVTDFSEMQ